MGLVLRGLGRQADAVACWHEALAIFQQLGGSGASEAAEVRALLDEPHPASGPNQRVGSGQSGPARHSRQ